MSQMKHPYTSAVKRLTAMGYSRWVSQDLVTVLAPYFMAVGAAREMRNLADAQVPNGNLRSMFLAAAEHLDDKAQAVIEP